MPPRAGGRVAKEGPFRALETRYATDQKFWERFFSGALINTFALGFENPLKQAR
jgi:hypothetical protein